MKKIVCEMCSGNEFVKDGDFFVCQSCGTKYTPDDAKRMMVEIEGKVDVSGSSVKIDQSEELEKLYQLARRAKENNDSENGAKYYAMILEKRPDDWEASFYSILYDCSNCVVAQIESAGNRVANSVKTIVSLIAENLSNENEKRAAIEEVTEHTLAFSNMLYNAAKNTFLHLGSVELQMRKLAEYVSHTQTATSVALNLGNIIEERLGAEFAKKYSVMCWKAAASYFPDASRQIKLHNMVQPAQETVNALAESIRKYEPDYITPTVSTKGACYVATCVYGSYDCPQVWTLRRFRDDTLAATWYGRAFIRTYYAVSPTLVRWFGETKWFRAMWKKPLDKMVAALRAKGVVNTPYQDKC